ncbi:MAG: sigma-54-dependent Fis family transcriptional regulator [Desulfacinum sp.]|jgi:two-component system response regulator HydG|nr:sigma-54-dependent Fis family transcriptional regulator [Desulfacinum sp.]
MTRGPSILIVDDEFSVQESLRVWFQKSGYEAEGAASGQEALEKLSREAYDIVFLDIMMPGMNGLEALRRIKEEYPGTLVVMMTAYASIESAVEAMKEGASDYLLKPLDPDLLDPLIARLMHMKELMDENVLLREQVSSMVRFENLVGRSRAMERIFAMIRDVAPTDSPVLITGETGTGKEMVAKAIHAVSPRADAPFVAVNCGAFPEHLLESELFGHEKGAFTGATQARKGRLELCHGGTLFLDEIGEISPRMQVDLLRVLDEKRFFRVGGEKPIQVDFRVIAATNRDLSKAIAEGRFRSDLFYRLNVISIHVPPLRERVDDIPLLATHFLKRYSRETNKQVDAVSREAMELLKSYSWPGNVRELQNAMERAVVLAKKRRIGLEDLAFLQAPPPLPSADMTLEEVERRHIERVLRSQSGNISRAAEILGIHRSTLHKKVQHYGITCTRGRGRPRGSVRRIRK